MIDRPSDLALADRHLAQAIRLVGEQERRILRQQQRGYSTELSEKFVTIMQAIRVNVAVQKRQLKGGVSNLNR